MKFNIITVLDLKRVTMAGFVFEGEVDDLSIRQQEFICEVLKENGFKNNKIIIEAVGQAGDNYMANVKRITVETDGVVFKMIAKIAPTNEIARARSNIVVTFSNENVMYQEILPYLVDLQKSAGVPEDDLFRYAKCYGMLKEPPYELILLEDLKLSDYIIFDRFKPLDNETIKLILKQFATLHSLSFVFKEKDPRIFGSYCKKLVNYMGTLCQSQYFQNFLANLERDALEVLDDEKYKTAIRGSISKMHEEIVNMSKEVSQMKHSVVVQGDGWTNNIMFRVKDDDPVDCVMIDYQLSKPSSPVYDLHYMIFSCTDHETRHKHYNQWIDYYYLELDKSLAHFNMKASDVFPREVLNNDLKKYSKLLFDNSIMMFFILIRKSEDAAKVKEAMESGGNNEDVLKSFHMNNLDDESLSLFKSKLEGLVDSYREFGYLEEYID